MKDRGLVTWGLFLLLLFLWIVLGKVQIENLQNQITAMTTRLASTVTTKTQSFKLIPGPAGANGTNGLNGTNAVTTDTNTIQVQTVTVKGDQGDPGEDGKDGRNARALELCKFPDGTLGQRYVGDEDCNPIQTVD